MTNILLMAAQVGRTLNNKSETARRMASFYDEVTLRGHALKYLAAETDSAAVNAIAKKRPGSVLTIRVPRDDDAYYLRWPKDGIQSYTGFVAIADAPVPRRIVRRLGITNASTSSWCEGGLFLRYENLLVLSSAFRGSPRVLRGHYDIASLPHPYTSATYRKHRAPNILGGQTHIDLDCALIPTRTASPLLLTGELYYETYEPAIRSLAKRIGAIIHVVAAKEADRRVLNLIVLPPHDVIIPAGCPSTRKVLEKHVGREHVIRVRIDEHFNYNAGIGGLGCMSSVIDSSHCGRVSMLNREAYRATPAL